MAWAAYRRQRPGEPEIVAKLRDGFEGVERSFVALLERNGIVADDPVGKPFDANLHEAMAEQPSQDHPPGTVVQSWSRAWTLNGRLLRPGHGGRRQKRTGGPDGQNRLIASAASLLWSYL